MSLGLGIATENISGLALRISRLEFGHQSWAYDGWMDWHRDPDLPEAY